MPSDSHTQPASQTGWLADLPARERLAAEVLDLLASLTERQGQVASSPSPLLSCLSEYQRLAAKAEELFIWGKLLTDADPQSEDAMELFADGEGIVFDVEDGAAFVLNEVAALTEEQWAAFCAEEPALNVYAHWYRRLLADHQHRPEHGEEMLAVMENNGQSYEDIYRSLLYADVSFPAVSTPSGDALPLSWKTYQSLSRPPAERGFLQEAYEAAYGTLKGISKTAAAILTGHARNQQAIAAFRGYASVLDGMLAKDQVQPEIFARLIEETRSHLPLMHRFAEQIATAVNAPTIGQADWKIHLVAEEDFSYSFDEARTLLLEALAPLGAAHLERVQRALDHVVLAPKVSALYAVNIYNRQPLVLVTYRDTLSSLLTVAHELGHAVHMQATNEHQPFVYSDVPTVPSEFAALTHEWLVLEHLLEHEQDPNRRAALLVTQANRFRVQFFRQVMMTEFEQHLHDRVAEGLPLTAKGLAKQMNHLQQAYFGPAFATDELSGYDWVRAQHLFYTFYMYSYPVAFAGATALVEALREDPSVAERYAEFLTRGGSGDVHSLMLSLGLDPTSPEHYRPLFRTCERLLDRMEALLPRT